MVCSTCSWDDFNLLLSVKITAVNLCLSQFDLVSFPIVHICPYFHFLFSEPPHTSTSTHTTLQPSVNDTHLWKVLVYVTALNSWNSSFIWHRCNACMLGSEHWFLCTAVPVKPSGLELDFSQTGTLKLHFQGCGKRVKLLHTSSLLHSYQLYSLCWRHMRPL